MKSVFAVLLGSAILVMAVHASATCLSPRCDLDGNGAGGRLPDYAIFLNAFGSKKGEAKFNPVVDFDGSGTITTVDYAIFSGFCPLQQQ